MKVLQTEQQIDLRELLETLNGYEGAEFYNIDVKNNLHYWIQELKPKRVRRNPKEST